MVTARPGKRGLIGLLVVQSCLLAYGAEVNQISAIADRPAFVFPSALRPTPRGAEHMPSLAPTALDPLNEEPVADPDSPITVLSATDQELLALSYEERAQWADAYATWERMAKENPTDAYPGLHMGLCLLGMQRGQEALQFLREQARLFPRDPAIPHLLAATYWLSGDLRAAWRTLARANGTTQLAPDALLFLAWICVQQGDHEEAIGWLRRALVGSDPKWQDYAFRQPAFAILKASPLYDALREELALAEYVATEAPPVPGRATTAHKTADLPDSLQVAVSLQKEIPAPTEDGAQAEDRIEAGLRLRSSKQPTQGLRLWNVDTQ